MGLPEVYGFRVDEAAPRTIEDAIEKARYEEGVTLRLSEKRREKKVHFKNEPVFANINAESSNNQEVLCALEQLTKTMNGRMDQIKEDARGKSDAFPAPNASPPAYPKRQETRTCFNCNRM